jgi:hypothetical protein
MYPRGIRGESDQEIFSPCKKMKDEVTFWDARELEVEEMSWQTKDMHVNSY